MGFSTDAITLELFVNRFRSIATRMGELLRRTSVSTNVKERLDFSCALLDTRGELVVNAPHVPVHLGALGLCVRTVAAHVDMGPGDVIVTNHPAFGGSHLPDVTVITPIHDDDGTLLGYAANRAHHAEIGGTRPGSMPPGATRLDEEGVIIAPMYLVRAGVAQWESLEQLLTQSRWPTRCLEDNLADLRAAVAANHLALLALRQLVDEHGRDLVLAAMEDLKQLAANTMAGALAKLPDTPMNARELLDDGTPLCVSLQRTGNKLIVDFAGSGARHPGNLNATPAIVRAVVLYVLRLLVGEATPGLPLNEGLLADVDIRIPHDSLLNPDFTREPLPAVVGGNIETSQRLAGTLLKALGLCASSQGTMNNVVFGNARFGYYETIGGGSGATADADGASAVQCHMTNTRITDVEVLEHRYPARLRRFAIRPDSGGAGAHRGGDGIVREWEFLEPLEISLLTQHRVQAPYGLDGGAPGKTGRQYLVRGDGTRVDLGGIAEGTVEAGDRLVIETPGGGGFGAP